MLAHFSIPSFHKSPPNVVRTHSPVPLFPLSPEAPLQASLLSRDALFVKAAFVVSEVRSQAPFY